MQRLPRPDTNNMRMWHGAWLRANHYTQDLFIARELLEQDDYRFRKMTWQPDMFIDIGAHCGYAALLARQLWPACKIVCVEPIEENAAVCRRNCPSADTIVAACAYGADSVRIDVRLSGEHTGGSFVTPNGNRVVPAVTLEEILAKAHGDVLLKLDCEGGEFGIVEHCKLLGLVREIRGESHGHAAFIELIQRKLPNWPLTVWRDSHIGLFKLERPA